MMKRFLATLLVLVLALGMVGSAWAEDDDEFKFSAMLASELSAFATAGTAISSENRVFVAAVMFMEYSLALQQDGRELESSPLWEDCLITRMDNIVIAAFSADDGVLMVYFDTNDGSMLADLHTGTLTTMKAALTEIGCTSIYTVDGEDWTDTLQQILQILSGDD